MTDVATQAEITKKSKRGISFELLRWTGAVQDHKKGVEETSLRQKLGISEVTWLTTRKKLAALVPSEQS